MTRACLWRGGLKGETSIIGKRRRSVQLYCNKCYNSTGMSTEMALNSACDPIYVNSENVNNACNPIYVDSGSESDGEGSEIESGDFAGAAVDGRGLADVTFDKDGGYLAGGILYDAYGLPIPNMFSAAEVGDRSVKMPLAAQVEDVDGAGAAVDADRAGSSEEGSAGAATVEACACWCGAKLGSGEEECDEAVYESLSDLHPHLDRQEIHDMAEGMFCPVCNNPDPEKVLVCGNDQCDGYLCLECCDAGDVPPRLADFWTCRPDCEDKVMDAMMEMEPEPTGAGNEFIDKVAAVRWANDKDGAHSSDEDEAVPVQKDDSRMDKFIVQEKVSGALCLLGGQSALSRAVAQANAQHEGALFALRGFEQGPPRVPKRKRQLSRPKTWSDDESPDESSDDEGDERPNKAGRC